MVAFLSVNPLVRHLSKDSILTSSELIDLLKVDGLSEDNARQILRRNANGEVWRSESLRLPKDERLFCLKSRCQTLDFVEAIGHKLHTTNRWGLARCLQALGSQCALHKVDVMRLLAVSPAQADGNGGTKKRLYEDDLAGLQEIGVKLVQQGTPFESIVGPYVTDAKTADDLATRATVAVRGEALLARILVERFRRQNIFSWNRVELPDPENPYTVFNSQVFSSYGFSYLSPLVRWKNGTSQPTPCPVLIDCYQGLCSIAHVRSFLQRIDRATNRGRSRLTSLGVIGARDFQRDAWAEARRKGLWTVNFRDMFGQAALEAMVKVEELLHCLAKDSLASSAEGQFEDFSHLLDDLKTNPVVGILRAIGLEALAGLILRTIGYEQVELGRIVPWQNTNRDVDVFGFRDDELRVIECKAYHKNKSVPAHEVKKFFTETLPAIKKWLRDRGRNFSICQAELWTTGPLGRQARETLYSLERPATDQWKMLKGDEIHGLLPRFIKRRGTELLNAIAIEETDGHEPPDS